MKFTKAHIFAPSAMIVAALLTMSPSAVAAPPEKGPAPGDFSADLLAGEACPDFPLRVEASGSNVTVRTFYDRQGDPVRILQAGRGYTLTYTNLDTGESLTIRPTGSNRTIVDNGDTLTITETGTAGIILFPSDTPKGPSSTQFYGRIVYTVVDDGSFTLTSLKTSGTSIDICARLA
ncbi:hypothetical protein [Arthrobacter sp. NicSoilC5]|uniref:hypothetical protein n=1 Tax=Micrococcaceae TaxID=1268 RepID=UPI001CC55164|nr:hypothetical protein [Arthrobacter sp. NicSoilC5]BCW81789.1 hypothetical protein NicSoilC5_38080 [Arthrobacter sp. NicSoilC5]